MPNTERIPEMSVTTLGILDLKDAKPGSKVFGRIIVPPATKDCKGHEIDFILKGIKKNSFILTTTGVEGERIDFELAENGLLDKLVIVVNSGMKQVDKIKIGTFILDSIGDPEEPKVNGYIQGVANCVSRKLTESNVITQEDILFLEAGDRITFQSNDDRRLLHFMVESEFMRKDEYSYIKLGCNLDVANQYHHVIAIRAKGINPNKVIIGAARNGEPYKAIMHDRRSSPSADNLVESFKLIHIEKKEI